MGLFNSPPVSSEPDQYMTYFVKSYHHDLSESSNSLVSLILVPELRLREQLGVFAPDNALHHPV